MVIVENVMAVCGSFIYLFFDIVPVISLAFENPNFVIIWGKKRIKASLSLIRGTGALSLILFCHIATSLNNLGTMLQKYTHLIFVQ